MTTTAVTLAFAVGSGVCGLTGCGGDGGADEPDGDVARDGDGETSALPDFTVKIEASALTGNTPLTAEFTATADGIEVAALTLRWIVDDVLAGSEPTLSFPFYRAGASTVTLEAELRDEAGNVKTASDTVRLTLLGCADLQFDRVTLELPTDVPPGATVTLDVGRVRNEGDRIDGPFSVALGLSLDDHWDAAADVLLPGVTFDGMDSGLATESAIELAALSFTLPDDVAPGTYYVFAVADPDGQVNECQEANNARLATNSINVDPEAGKLADLSLENVSFAEGLTVAQGENLSYSFRLKNSGEADARQFRYAFWISDDDVLDREHDRPILLPDDEAARVQSMPAGFELGFFKSWRVPDDLPDGAWWVIGEVDATGVIAEPSDDNNVGVSPYPFTMRHVVPQCYDFDLTALEVAPLSTYWGGSVLLSATVHNGGVEDTPDGWLLRAYLSLVQTLSPDNAIVVGTYPLEAIPAGGTKTYEILVPISSSLPVIPHYLGVVIDPTGAYTECNEANNAKLYPEPVKINAIAEVDVSASDFEYHPDVVAAGEPIKVEYHLGNAGTTAATTFQVGVVLSADGAVTREDIAAGRDVVIDRLTIPSLQPEEVREVIRDVVVPAGLDHSVGEWTIAVMADLDGFLTSDRAPANNLVVAPERLVVTDAVGGCFEDALEDNDQALQAVLVEPGAVAAGTGSGTGTGTGTGERLGSCGDEDWYLVDVPAGVSLAVDVHAEPIVSVPETPANLNVEIRDPAGAIVGRATLGPDYGPRAWAVPAAGAYTIRVAGQTARDRAAYDLTVAFLEPVEGIDVVPFEVVPAPASAYAGGRLSIAWREVNLGTRAAGARSAKLWLSRDRELQTAVDVLLGEHELAPLAAGATVGADVVVALPATLQPGTWYAIVESDAGGALAEVDEGNDRAVGGPVSLDPLRVCNDDDLEPNDEPIIATNLDGSPGIGDAVVCPGLEDWYAVELDVGDSAEVAIDYNYEQARGRLVLEMWAPDGQGALVADAKNGSARVSLPYAYRAGRWLFRVRNDTSIPSQAPYTYDLDVNVGVGALGLTCGAERYEPNDAVEGAGPIGCGTIDAELCNADLDWYVVPAVAGQRLRVQAVNLGAQILVQLFLPGGTSSVATIYGNGATEYTPAASGPVYLKVTPRYLGSPLTAFDYSLTVSGIDGADLALRDLTLELGEVPRGEDVGVGFTVENQCSLDARPFEITAWLSLDDVVDGGDLPLLVLDQRDGLAEGDSLGFRYKLTVPVSTEPGFYYVIVEADSDDDVVEGNEIDNTLALPLEVGEPCDADRFEPNDVKDEATVMGEGEALGLAVCPFDQDWFAVTTRAGDKVTVKALFAAADGDLDLRVYNPLVSPTIPIAISQGTDDDEELTVTTPLATTLYVRVSGYGGAAAPYELVVDIH